MSASCGLEKQYSERTSLPPSMVERMTLILDIFSGPGDRVTLEQVARSTHLPRSTAHRILDQLVRLRWLDHSSFGYSLGSRSLMHGADNAPGANDLRAVAAPLLHDLVMRTGLVVHLAVPDGAHVRYLDKVGGRLVHSVPSRVGGRTLAHRTALGKAMWAWLSAEEVDAICRVDLAEPAAIIPPVDLASLHRELHQVRSRGGLAFERGARKRDVSCCAVAVRAPEGPIAAISVAGVGGVPLERVAPLVVRAARQVSAELFPEADLERRGRRVGASGRDLVSVD